ncbi:MAG TPA: DinB family protein [Candidatus Aquilonibacter sp.]|nr:DinB family protein [Candidatus Aquilonibacter sp.]
MRLRNLCAAVVFCGLSLAGSAQMGTMSAKVDVGSQMSPVQAEEELLNLFEHQFMGVAKTMPADKYSFAPAAANFVPGQGAKYEGVRTFAQEVAHVTQANYYFGSRILGEKPPAEAGAVSKLTTKDELLKAAEDSFVYAHKAVASITPENAFVTIEGVDGLHTRAVIASFIAAHGYDHYGQMVEYLRMNGLVPPGSK